MRAAVCLWLSMLLTGAASAQTVSTDRASFLAMAGPVVIDGYETGYPILMSLTDSAMSAVTGIARYTATGNPDANLVFDSGEGTLSYCAGCNGSFRLGFGGAVTAVAFDYVNVPELVASTPPTPYFAYVVFGDFSSASYALTARQAPVYPVPDFFGITAPAGVLSIHLGLADGSATKLGGFAIDNLTVSAVAEPAPNVLLALGLAALMGWRQRRPPGPSTIAGSTAWGPRQ